MGGGGGGGNTTTQSVMIPEFEQEFARSNQDLAKDLTANPFPVYKGQLIAGQNQQQQAGQAEAMQAGTNWQPALATSNGLTLNAVDQGAFNNSMSGSRGAIQTGQSVAGLQANATGQAQALTNPNAIRGYMNPFIEQALAPQVQDLQLQLANQQQGINSQATQAGAFGDARQGAQAALQNLYGNQAMNQLIGTGYNNAYTQAQQAVGQAQQTQLGAAGQYGNIVQGQLGASAMYNQMGGLMNQQDQVRLQQGAQEAAIAKQLQDQTLAGANAQYGVGQQNQQQQQMELNSAYQQYLNQVNWPFQMLNVREGALSNSPYNIQTATTLPNANTQAQGFGAAISLAGLLGGMGGGGGGGARPAFGATVA
jgi:hypothetical protein